ncbi:DUF1614 domain-containing protein [Telmatobacter bradus]|uniref:DUF1614 domain-containing protein n=1 Tax=Telmatobacter bradus TaxID=474953 RepID=UPI003B42E84F
MAMQFSGMHYFPVEWPFLLALFLLFSLLVVLIELRVLHYAYERMGISSHCALLILLSLYLVLRNRIVARGVVAAAVVALVTHSMAQPVRGVGITLPVFIPPIVAVICALLLSWRKAAPLAYVGGSMGVLIGADLMNLDKIHGLGAPVASIGGAGTFDGVFLVGIVAVLLASLIQPGVRRTA